MKLYLSQISLLTHGDCSPAIIISLIMVNDFANNLWISFVAAIPYSSIKVAKHYDRLFTITFRRSLYNSFFTTSSCNFC